ncbi:unnamed protein product, partial [Pylaiella littoralis]
MKKNTEMEAMLNSPKTTVYTDQHASHGPALAQFAKNCWRRFCLVHLIRHLPAVKDSNGWVYQAAREPTEQTFMNTMQLVKASQPAAYDALMAKDLRRWAHHA